MTNHEIVVRALSALTLPGALLANEGISESKVIDKNEDALAVVVTLAESVEDPDEKSIEYIERTIASKIPDLPVIVVPFGFNITLLVPNINFFVNTTENKES